MLRRNTKVTPPMILKWDALLLGAVLLGGSMLIENSHRIDTGSADEVAALPACTEPSGDRADASSSSDDVSSVRFSVSAAADDDATLGACN
jgi:hypothetical protein